jgi:hypothetical protein
MSDIVTLKQILDESMIIPIQEKQEGTHTKYFVNLEESKSNYAVTIKEMPKPDEVIVINVDKFEVVPKFKGGKGIGRRADYVIIANTDSEKVILCIELKKGGKPNDWIIQQLTGAKCFILYCQILVKHFWHKCDFLDEYEYRFVTFKKIPIDKKTTRYQTNQQRSSATEVHNSPEKMLKISSLNSLRFGQLI